MTVFKNKKTLLFVFLVNTISLATITANNPFTEHSEGLKKDTIGGIKTDSIASIVQDFTRYQDKTFAVTKNTTVVLSNKYGTIDVHATNGSQVIIKVKITVMASNQTQADKIFERVNIAFIDGPDFVKTETSIENMPKESVFLKGNEANNCDFRIDYDVRMPVGNRLDLTNRHGNTTIAALKSAVKIDQKYGDFRLDGASSATVILAYGGGQLSDLNTLYGNVRYGKLTSPYIKNGYLTSTYSQLRFDQIGAIEILSNYDTYEINNVSTLKANCKYGTMNVRSVDNLTANGTNTAYKIQKIEHNADFDCQYGTIRIGSIKNNFGHINITGNGTNCIVAVDPNVSYQFDMNGIYSNMNQPTSIRPFVDKKEGTRREVMGWVGSNKNTKSTIRVRLTYGEFKIK